MNLDIYDPEMNVELGCVLCGPLLFFLVYDRFYIAKKFAKHIHVSFGMCC